MEKAQVIFLVISILYLLSLTNSLIHQKIELYDALHLTSIIVIVAAFIISPDVGKTISEILNVKFPFVVMFSIIFIEIYFFLHRIVLRVQRYDVAIRKLTQELALLKLQTQDAKKFKSEI